MTKLDKFLVENLNTNFKKKVILCQLKSLSH
jgi:hypothetical protein